MKKLCIEKTKQVTGAVGSCTTSISNKIKDVYVNWSHVQKVYPTGTPYVYHSHRAKLYQEVATVTCTGTNGAVHVLPSTVIAEHLEVKI